MQPIKYCHTDFKRIALAAISALAFFCAGCAKENADDHVKTFERFLPTQPVVYERSVPHSKGGVLLTRAVVPKVSYDVKRTDSLISPMVATVSFDMTTGLNRGETIEEARANMHESVHHGIIELALQNGKWKVTSFKTQLCILKGPLGGYEGKWRDGTSDLGKEDQLKFYAAMGLPH